MDESVDITNTLEITVDSTLKTLIGCRYGNKYTRVST